MPASPHKWNTYSAPALSQLHSLHCNAMKRKTSDCMQPSLTDCLDSAPEFAGKRVCRWPQNFESSNDRVAADDTADMVVEDTQQSADHTTTTHIPPPNHLQLQQLASVQHQAAESRQQMEPASQQLAMDNMDFQSGMVMNINEDDVEINDYASAYDAMDGEGAVDVSQYGSRFSNQHEQHCFGAEKSPNSGVVRCYCRPTWDTVSNSQSFFSDVY